MLKRLSAILLLATFVFNLYGYRIVIDFMKDEASESLQAKVDNQDYNDEVLLSIKTPLNLPYYTNSAQFERVNGSIEINGVIYDFIKRRVFNDTLELLCIPNHMKTHLQSAKNDIAKQSNEITGQQNKTIPIPIKIIFPDYYQPYLHFQLNPPGQLLTRYLASTSEMVNTRSLKCLEHPPQING